MSGTKFSASGTMSIDDSRKMILFISRQLARDRGLVPADTPLIITDRVF